MTEKIDYKDVLIISCIFGDKYTILYDAPASSDNCYFFTNNAAQKDNIVEKGWKYEYVDFELTEEEIPCSLQAKYIKFLQFLDSFDGKFSHFKQILYFDHKHNVLEKDVIRFIDISNENNNQYNVLIRPHEKTKKLWEEVDDACYQYKYKKNMGKTIKMIKEKVADGSLQNDKEIPIAVTSLIFYNNYQDIMPMLNDIYNACMTQEQPECQIFWAVFSQKYNDKIKLLEYYDVNPETIWIYPPYPWVDTSNIPLEEGFTAYDDDEYCWSWWSWVWMVVIVCFVVYYFLGKRGGKKWWRARKV
jgi:hypothetical protein